MPPSIRRRFTLLDGMILIAALAAGFTLIRWSNLYYKGEFPETTRLINIALLLLPLNAAMIALHFRKPRRNVRRLVRQPGIQTGFAVGFGLLLASFGSFEQYLVSPDAGSPRDIALAIFTQYLPSMFGPHVALVWLVSELR